MRMLAQLAGIDPGLGSGGQSDVKDRLIRVISRGDVSQVRSMCQENKSLVNHKVLFVNRKTHNTRKIESIANH